MSLSGDSPDVSQVRELLADRELERISYSEPFYSLLYRFADEIPRRSITAREIVKAVLEASDRQSPEPLEPTFMRDGSEPCEVCGCNRTAELVRREDGAVIHVYCTSTDCERSKHL